MSFLSCTLGPNFILGGTSELIEIVVLWCNHMPPVANSGVAEEFELLVVRLEVTVVTFSLGLNNNLKNYVVNLLGCKLALVSLQIEKFSIF